MAIFRKKITAILLGSVLSLLSFGTCLGIGFAIDATETKAAQPTPNPELYIIGEEHLNYANSTNFPDGVKITGLKNAGSLSNDLSLVIPEYIGGKPVREVDGFEEIQSIVEVFFPYTLRSVTGNSFTKSNVQKIVFRDDPDPNTIQKIAANQSTMGCTTTGGAFTDLTNPREIYFGNSFVSTGTQSCFTWYDANIGWANIARVHIKKIYFGPSITLVSNSAFNAIWIDEIEFAQDGILELRLNNSVFKWSHGFKSLILPARTVYCGEDAFGSTTLTHLTFNSHATANYQLTLTNGAFSKTAALAYVYLSKHVVYCRSGAFAMQDFGNNDTMGTATFVAIHPQAGAKVVYLTSGYGNATSVESFGHRHVVFYTENRKVTQVDPFATIGGEFGGGGSTILTPTRFVSFKFADLGTWAPEAVVSVPNLIDDRTRLQHEVAELTERAQNLTAQVNKYEENLAEAEANLTTAQNNYAVLLAEKNGLQSERDTLYNLINNSTNGLLKQIADKNTEISNLNTAHAAEISAKQTIIDGLQTSINNQTNGYLKQIADLNTQLQVEITGSGNLEQKIIELNADIVDLTNQKKVLYDQIYDPATGYLKQIANGNAAIAELLADANANVFGLNTQIQTALTTITQLRAEIAESDIEHAAEIAEIQGQLNAEIVKLETANAAIAAAGVEYSNATKKYFADIAEKNAEISQKQGEINAKQAIIDARDGEIAAKNVLLQNAETDISNLQANIVTLRTEKEAALNQLGGAQGEINRLNKLLESPQSGTSPITISIIVGLCAACGVMAFFLIQSRRALRTIPKISPAVPQQPEQIRTGRKNIDA